MQLLIEEEFAAATASLTDGSWRARVPGKQVLAGFAGRAGLQSGRAKTIYLATALDHPRAPFEEILSIFEYMANHPT